MRPIAPTALGLLVLLGLAACPAEDADPSGTDDTAAPDDTGGPDDTGPDDTGPDDTGDPATVSVTYSVWTPESGCWTVETAELTYEYWWPYGPESEVACNDVAWYLVDGDRCLLFSYECTDTEPTTDPAFGGSSEQEATCAGVVADTQAGLITDCS